MNNIIVKAIMEDVYYPIEVSLNQRELVLPTSGGALCCLSLRQAKKLLADLEAEIEIVEWEEAKKKKANPDPEVSEKREFAEKMVLQPSSVYNW